jgi:membrane-anchored protein YejM (alkaline phosphatase superfamily)
MRDVRADLLRWCGWFFLCAAALFVLLALRYLPVVNLPEGAAARSFTVAMFLSQGVVLAGLGALLVLPLVLIVPRRRLVMAVSFLLALTGLCLAVVDGFVWQQYRLHLDASIWNLVTGGAFGETFVFATRTWLKLGLVVLVLGSLLAGCAWLAARLVRRRGRFAGVVLAVSLGTIFVVHNGIYAWASAAGYTPITSQARILPAYRPLTAKRWFREHGLMPRVQAPIKLATGMGLNYPRAALSCTAPSSPPNVLFVVIDSWRADALKPEVTPNLARLAEESQRFTNHVSGGNATRIGMFSLFYGLPGTYWHDMLGERRGAVFVQELMRQGYDVEVFRSAPLFSPEFDRTIFVGVPKLRLRSDGERAWQRDRDLTTTSSVGSTSATRSDPSLRCSS